MLQTIWKSSPFEAEYAYLTWDAHKSQLLVVMNSESAIDLEQQKKEELETACKGLLNFARK